MQKRNSRINELVEGKTSKVCGCWSKMSKSGSKSMSICRNCLRSHRGEWEFVSKALGRDSVRKGRDMWKEKSMVVGCGFRGSNVMIEVDSIGL